MGNILGCFHPTHGCAHYGTFRRQRRQQEAGLEICRIRTQGVPVRLAMGARDLENNTVEVARRDTLTKETMSLDGIELYIKQLLDEIQANIYQKAIDFRTESTREVNSYDEFKVEIEKGGFLMC